MYEVNVVAPHGEVQIPVASLEAAEELYRNFLKFQAVLSLGGGLEISLHNLAEGTPIYTFSAEVD